MSAQGYELDEKGNVKKISNIYAASQWFKTKFVENNIDNDKIRKIEFAERVLSDFVKQYDDGQQSVQKFTIAWVVKVDYENHFGSLDTRYYYIMYRTKWFHRWANTYYESLKKYFNHDGLTLKMDIPKHAFDLKRDGISTLVNVTEDTHLWYMSMKDVIDCYKKWGSVTDKYNQISLGLPKSMFSDNEDVNKY